MTPFVAGHGAHPDWRFALSLATTQIDAQLNAQRGAAAPTLGVVYVTDAYAAQADALHAALRQHWPGVHWVGCVGVGVLGSGVEYFDEPALSLMLTRLPSEHFQVFSGARPLQRDGAFSALVHADPGTPELPELLHELSARTRSGYLFGGLAASRGARRHIADGVWEGGLSGVAFAEPVRLLSRVTQGCQPIGPVRRITAARDALVLELDGRPALRCLLDDLGLSRSQPRELLARLRQTLVGLTDPAEEALSRGGQFGADTRVRHIVGVDPRHEALAVGERVELGMRLAFCHRDAAAARRDLVRICSEIREELSPEPAELAPSSGPGRAPVSTTAAAGPRIAGAIYVSCSGRGGPHFGAPSAEAQIVRHALGDVPLTGFFAAGEIARHHLYGYTGVLTVFLAD